MSFGDIRVAKRADWLIDRIVATGSLVLRKDRGKRALAKWRCIAFYPRPMSRWRTSSRRWRGEPRRKARVCRLLDGSGHHRDQFCRSRQEAPRFWAGSQRQGTPAFYSPGDRDRYRDGGRAGAGRCRHLDARARNGWAARRSRTIENKESARWLAGCEAAAQSLRDAASLTMVADRESDIYLLFARRPRGGSI